MSSVKIVRLSAGNATILNDVAEDVFDNAVVPFRAEAFLETDNHFMVVALSRDMVVGMGSACRSARCFGTFRTPSQEGGQQESDQDQLT